MRIIGRRRIAAAAAAAAAAVACIAGPATSASASTTPVLYAGENQVAHACTVIGSAAYNGTTYQGVLCVDLLASVDQWGQTRVDSQDEAICQTSTGKEVQCADVSVTGAFATATGGYTQVQFHCGHAAGPCSSGRNFVNGTTEAFPDSITDANCQLRLSDNVWAIIVSDYNGGDTDIELPGSGRWVYLDPSNANDSANESTGHYYICP